jgi:peptide chain release factor 1
LDEGIAERELAREAQELESRLADPSTLSDPKRLAATSKRYKQVTEILSVLREMARVKGDREVAREMLQEARDDEERDLAREEIERAEARLRELEARYLELTSPEDPMDGRDVIMTIQGAEGGEEANLFAKDLFDMYVRFAERRGWKVQVVDAKESERGGFDEVTMIISGKDAWARLKHEAGPHRVQRVPVTEASGRIHTSSAVVTVVPEAEEVEVEINPSDIRVDVFRSTGPGGQSVNTTDSAVRITHLPTGIVVSVQDERSQIQNRARAMQILRSRLLALKRAEQEQALAETRRSQAKTGARSEKIRTYNFKENRVTDHRIGLTLYKLDKILAGELEELSDALVKHEREQRLAEHAPTGSAS